MTSKSEEKNGAAGNRADAVQAEIVEVKTAEFATASGEGEKAAAEGSAAAVDELQNNLKAQQALQSKLLAANFGNLVTLFMQSAAHKHLTLEDLPERIVTPLVNRQAAIAEGHKEDAGYTFPVSAVLWARVSDEVEKKLSENLDQPVQMEKEDWTSGDNFWVIESVGDPRFVQHLLAKLRMDVFKDKPVKARVQEEDGTKSVRVYNIGD